VIHQDTAHHLRSHAKELRPVLPFGAALVYEAEIDFVDERCGLKSVSHRFVAHRS
jgi:hypothetical protein